jgi:guanosine-3',5'-bis(diphosphate) 3'-pyrophosphohydrolase
MTSIIKKAKVFIREPLLNSKNPKPVLKHSLAVGQILEKFKYSENIIIAGYLHDIIEDTNIKPELIQKKFGIKILRLIELNTFDISIKEKIESYKELFSRCKKNKSALIVKTADLLDNSHYCCYQNDGKPNEWWIEKLKYFLKIARSKIEDEPIYIELLKRYKEVINTSMTFNFPKKAVKKFVKESYKEMYNVPALKRFLKHLPANSSILDFGCGGGQDSLFMAQKGNFVTGIDITAEMIRLAKKKAKHSNTAFKKSSIESFFSKQKFDGIWSSKVFKFIPLKKQDAVIKKVFSILKPGGVLYITAKPSDKRRDYEVVERGSVRKLITRKTFESLLRENGFRIVHFQYWKNKVGMEIIAKKK